MDKTNKNLPPPSGRAGVGFEVEGVLSRGVSFFKQGYNCSQSVALAFADYYGIPEPLMARMAASFGGGIGRMRETCGAACAMFMLAGLEVCDEEDSIPVLPISENPYPNAALKKKNYEVVQRLAASFREQTGSIICRELLAKAGAKTTDSYIPEARTDDYYRKRPCVRMVETAIRIYCDYLRQRYEDEK